mgnify:CR=1 FL=1
MQRNYFSILFFIRRTRLLKNDKAPIGLRITVNGQRAEMQIKRSVAEERWNASKGCVTGKDRKALELNQYLESVRTKIYQIHREQGASPTSRPRRNCCKTASLSRLSP